ncbi:MAG: hypothetical protein ACFFDT_20080 [Candidatus Hodarchaeota archaeon]
MGAEKYYEIGCQLDIKAWKNQSKQRVQDYESRLLEHLEQTARNFSSNGCRVKSVTFQRGTVMMMPWVNLKGAICCDMNPVKDVIVYDGGPGHDGEKEFLKGLLDKLYIAGKTYIFPRDHPTIHGNNHGIRVKYFQLAII